MVWTKSQTAAAINKEHPELAAGIESLLLSVVDNPPLPQSVKDSINVIAAAYILNREAPDDLTTDPSDPRIVRGSHDTESTPQHEVYLVLSEEERAKGFVRPLRRSYVHVGVDGTEQNLTGSACGAGTHMGLALCETYARNPSFYGATYCVGCQMHLPVSEFIWDDGERVGS